MSFTQSWLRNYSSVESDSMTPCDSHVTCDAHQDKASFIFDVKRQNYARDHKSKEKNNKEQMQMSEISIISQFITKETFLRQRYGKDEMNYA